MKIKAMNPMLDGFETEAQLIRATPTPGSSFLTLALESGGILSLLEAQLGQYVIVEATTEERAGLREAGFNMPDYTPAE